MIDTQDMLEKKKSKKPAPTPIVPEDDAPPTGPDGKYIKPRPYAKGGTASSRADGCATKGKTKGRIV